jgi:hypothetical protein
MLPIVVSSLTSTMYNHERSCIMRNRTKKWLSLGVMAVGGSSGWIGAGICGAGLLAGPVLGVIAVAGGVALVGGFVGTAVYATLENQEGKSNG